MSADRPMFSPSHPQPGAPGVASEDPTRGDEEAEEVGALDDAPDGQTPSDTTGSDESSLPPGAG
jgi:hypothetical protein